MALFDKKSPAEKVIAMFEALSEDDKDMVKTHFMEKAEDLEKAEDEREVDKIEEEKADTETETDEKAEEVKEESEEIGKDVNEAEVEEPTEQQVEEMAEESGELEETKEEEKPVMEGYEARLKALEEKFDKMFSMTEDTENKDIGISGYGASKIDNMDIDTRKDDIVRKLGGYAEK